MGFNQVNILKNIMKVITNLPITAKKSKCEIIDYLDNIEKNQILDSIIKNKFNINNYLKLI